MMILAGIDTWPAAFAFASGAAAFAFIIYILSKHL